LDLKGEKKWEEVDNFDDAVDWMGRINNPEVVADSVICINSRKKIKTNL
jgi:hypothetical protein